MDPIRLPGVVSEHDVGSSLTDHATDCSARCQPAVELAVDVAQEDDVDGAEDGRRVTLLLFTLCDECG